MVREFERSIAADHPALAGHFPHDPVVPGVVLLEEVIESAAATIPGFRLTAVPAVKFLAPLRPDEPFTIHLRPAGRDRLRFQCAREGKVLARGELRFDGASLGLASRDAAERQAT